MLIEQSQEKLIAIGWLSREQQCVDITSDGHSRGNAVVAKLILVLKSLRGNRAVSPACYAAFAACDSFTGAGAAKSRMRVTISLTPLAIYSADNNWQEQET